MTTAAHSDLRTSVRELCRHFPDSYWRALDRDQSYPEEFVQAMTRAGFLGALIPEEYGGMGLSLRETSIILEEVNRSGGNAGSSHAQIYISRVQHSDLMMLLARTTPLDEVERRSDGLSGVPGRPSQGKGFRYIPDGMNAERILIVAECIGDGRWFVDRAAQRARDRHVFGRPIGQNQGVQFPIARAQVNVGAADLMRFRAAGLFDRGEPCGAEANMAKLLAADASWEAANVAMQTYGGYGFTVEYDVERKFREARLYQVAPISTNLILAYIAEHTLGLPRSY